MSHCQSCTGKVIYRVLGASEVPECPGCGHEAEIVALRKMVRELLLELILHCPDTLHKEQLAEFDVIEKVTP